MLQELEGPFEITLLLSPESSDLQVEMQMFAEQIRGVAPTGAIELIQGAVEADPMVRPAMVLGSGDFRNIRYAGLPQGPEELPFIEAVSSAAAGRLEPSPPWAEQLTALTEPARLTVFMAPTCPHCPHAVRSALQVAIASPKIETTIIDATAFPEVAARFGARSVPLTVLDGERSWIGIVPAWTLVRSILERSTDVHQQELFASLLEVGRHDDAATRVTKDGGSALFFDHWRQSTLSDRIGLMLVAEAALELDAKTLGPILPELISLLDGGDASLRGDTADLLGKIGSPKAYDALERLLDDPNPDIAEIAEEALEEIRTANEVN
jgi:hypothetical protein